ncbi:MAG: 3-oxoacyl-[acyl-carrier-protein] synthase III C-terminal domain-containing protein [Syntrophales bacterium]
MLYLHGLGHFHPENVITNRFLEDLDIGTSNDWVLERVGIRERRTSLPLAYIRETKNKDTRAAYEAGSYTNAQTGAAAARKALAQAGIAPGDIGLVISGSSAPDHVTPSEAATVAAELEIEATCFDINAACATFGVQLSFLSKMRPESLPPYVLVVNPENLTRCIDYSDRNTAVLFGDGSAAAVVSATIPSRLRLLDSDCASKPSSWQKAIIPRTGYFQQDGNAVQGFAIRKMTEAVRTFQETYEGRKGSQEEDGHQDNGRRLLFVGHQANLSVLSTVCERSAIPDDCHWRNVAMFGNTGCSGAPAVVSQHWRDLGPGDCLIMALVGAGLTWSTLIWQMS